MATKKEITKKISFDQNPQRFLDRELSWLAFNARVLELAEDPNLFLLERVNFLAIFTSNIDEFFMVRVAGLKRRIAAELAVPSNSGKAPLEVLEEINKVARELQNRQANIFSQQIRPALLQENIHIVAWKDLDKASADKLQKFFANKVFPILTPLAIDPGHPFPYISGLSLNLAVVLREGTDNKEFFARIKVPHQLPRFVSVDGPRAGSNKNKPGRFIPLEEIIAIHLEQLFPGMKIVEHHSFRVTRNEDVEVEEDDNENLLQALEKELLRRRFGPPVRLEVTTDINPTILELIIRELDIEEADVYALPKPLDLSGLTDIANIARPDLRYPKTVGRTHKYLNEKESSKPADVFAAMRRRDILLHHPYDSFSTSVQAFLEQAATDPKVQAIKQTLYRTSGDSPIVDALIEAAQAGKQVLVLVEIKARFDEEANISWARKLEQSGVHVVYGIVGLKTHCKLSLVVRQDSDGIRRYCHVGTGNYHPKTARYYEDFGLLTCDDEVGEDLSKLFNQLSGYAPKSTFKRLLVAPRFLRNALVSHIQNEIVQQKAGKLGQINIKVNSIVDETIIDALYAASQAGVEVNLVVRGICALRPGLPGLSENIKVFSVLGRFLEHSRIFSFANGGDPVVYIGSSDMMHRNLDRRVETLVRLTVPEHLVEIANIFANYLSKEASSWRLDSEGVWFRYDLGEDGEPLPDVQSLLLAARKMQRLLSV